MSEVDEVPLCPMCGLALPPYSGRGRPRVVHSGSCARTRAAETDENQREARYRQTLRDAAVRAPLMGPEHVATDDEQVGTMQRLASAGFAPLADDPREDAPRHERARSQHRRAALASLQTTFADKARQRSAPACHGCLAFDYLLVTTVTAESLIRGRAEAQQDTRLRRHLAQDDVAAVMALSPS
ncbi:hypothetical protein GCM10023349_11100 [Nocardioides conyzicola]|uniref:Uncharacterized protein n=1 Tax=Nocardioides conyzicola TaxID=1651781 RepID=A0ABP8X1F2_9ACTN